MQTRLELGTRKKTPKTYIVYISLVSLCSKYLRIFSNFPMISIQSALPTMISSSPPFHISTASKPSLSFSFPRRARRSSSSSCLAMVQQTAQGPPGGEGGAASAIYAKEMERLSAKESLLLAFKDAGGFEALVAGKTNEVQKIDVNERITSLERLNPTPRPTTSPYLEGRWNFQWFGSGSPILSAARLFERFPSNVAKLSSMDAVIKDGTNKVTANMKLLFSIESKLMLSSRLTVEGPLRMKEEFNEGVLETPTIIEEAVPEQLRGALAQALSTMQQLPVPIRDAISSGLRFPLSGTYQRLFMISYLDEEILILRDTTGIPEVLTRIEAPASALPEPIAEYES